jgi:flagellar protein FlaG
MQLKVTGQGGQNNLKTDGYEIALNQNNMEVAKDVKQYDKEEELNKNDLKKAVKKLNNFLVDESSHAEYSVHDKFNTIIIKIVDDKTKKVIMELPSEKILDMVAKMCELVGVVFDKRA